MYAGIKQATGPIPAKSVPLKTKTGETITDKRKQMERWVEHYLELYSTENVVTDAALCAISQLPVMEELDEEATEEELRKAIDCLSAGKALGEDGIPPRSSSRGKKYSSMICTNYSVCAGRRVLSHTTCAAPR